MNRIELIKRLWNTNEIPNQIPSVIADALPPIVGIQNLDRCLRCTTAVHGIANHLYLLKSAEPKGKLVIVAQGHANSLEDLGVGDVVRSLVVRGFDVLLCGMPGVCGNEGLSNHNQYAQFETTSFNPLMYFVEPVIQGINQFFGEYSNVSAIGISGGGWLVTLAAAIDPRITLSIPVAGSLPWYLRSVGSIGDWEQAKANSILAYPLQYLLGCDSSGRRQVQVLNKHDACCFGYEGAQGAYGNAYSSICEYWLNPIVSSFGGSFRFVEDSTHSEHKISSWCVSEVILPELGEPPPFVVVVDDRDVGFSKTGNWSQYYNLGQGYRDGLYFAAAGAGASQAHWHFLGLTSGQYQVEASWSPHQNRATNATYEIWDGETHLQTVTKNQELGQMPFSWHLLGNFSVRSGSFKVVLSNLANEYVIADAIRITKI